MKVIEGNVASPLGFSADGLHAGFKKRKLDFGWIVSEVPASVAGVYTTNKVIAAPLIVTRNSIKKAQKMKAIVVNSGVANSCTGVQGMEDAYTMQKWTAEKLGVEPDLVGIASTGVIGDLLPMDTLKTGLSKLVVNGNSDDFSKAILTTDTMVKTVAVTEKFGRDEVTMAGVAKGSGMIHPNMATMLGFITTDCNISKELLNKALKEVIPDTFNMVSVDRDTSTNDTVLLLANGLAGNQEIVIEDQDYQIFKEALYYVNEYLAKAIAGDGEGATKLLEVQVHNADTVQQAKVIAKSVCTSPLVKTAVYGNDANWGRLLCAMGYSGEQFDPYNVDLSVASEFGELQLVAKGMATDYSEELATKILSSSEVKAIIDIHNGDCKAIAWGCDLTYDYVKINADYRS